MDLETKKRYWTICKVAAVLISALSLSPLVIPMGEYQPMVMGAPYPLVSTFVISVVMVVLTYIGTIVHPFEEE